MISHGPRNGIVLYQLKSVLIEIDTFEFNGNETFLSFFKILTDCNGSILNEFLFEKAGFFEEFVKTSLSDVFDHLFGEVGSLSLGSLFGDDAGFGSFVFSEPM